MRSKDRQLLLVVGIIVTLALSYVATDGFKGTPFNPTPTPTTQLIDSGP
jgi:hypothetical protein